MRPRSETVLEIRDLSLPIRLGWGDDERSVPQEVRFNIWISFTEGVPGEKTDHLSDTICYGTLCQKITRRVEETEFRLVEKLAQEIYSLIKETIGPRAQVRLETHKVNPPVPQLKGGVCYTIGDFSL